MEKGKKIQWTWDTYNHSVQVNVQDIEKNKRILIEWSAYDVPTMVEWVFTSRKDGTIYVSITNWGFQGDENEVAKQAVESTEGFAYVLSGLKALLEFNIKLNLVADKFPDKVLRK